MGAIARRRQLGARSELVPSPQQAPPNSALRSELAPAGSCPESVIADRIRGAGQSVHMLLCCTVQPVVLHRVQGVFLNQLPALSSPISL